MIKYIFTLSTLLDSKSGARRKYSPETIISGIFDQDLSEVDWILALGEIELIYGVEVPKELYDCLDLSLGEYAYELSQLPVISDELYPVFYDIKVESMRLTKRFIELEAKTDVASLNEKKNINKGFDELTMRLNLLLEYDNKNYLMN